MDGRCVQLYGGVYRFLSRERRVRTLHRSLLVVVVAAVLAGCQQMHESVDYERHSLSRLSMPLSGENFFWFDVRLTPEYPLESEAAETRRQMWLQLWLLQRGICPFGYEILERRPFEFQEYNPEQMDIRYKVSCLTSEPVATG